MKNCKKVLALFMALLMVCSMFTSLGITSFAADDNELTLDSSTTVTINGASVWLEFTPEESGYYSFESFSDENDPKVYLYDNPDASYFDYDDDGGSGVNFHLNTYLTEGVTYYFECSLFGIGSSSYASYDVKLTFAGEGDSGDDPSYDEPTEPPYYGSTPVITLTATEAAVGEEISVLISAQNIIGLESADLEINYDYNHLEFISIDYPESYGYYRGAGDKTQDGTVTWSFMYIESADADTDIAVLRFRVLEDTSSSISVSYNSWYGTDAPEVNNLDFTTTPPPAVPDIYTGETKAVEIETEKKVTIDISAEHFAGTEAATISLSYDPAMLEFSHVSEGDIDFDLFVGGSSDPGTCNISFAFWDSATYDGTLAHATFKVLQPGNTEVALSISNDDWSGTEEPAETSLVIYDEDSPATFARPNLAMSYSYSYSSVPPAPLLFVPEEDGTYIFYSTSTDLDPYGSIDDRYGWSIVSSDDASITDNHFDFCARAYLEAGEEYYLSCGLHGNNSGTFNVSIVKEPDTKLNIDVTDDEIMPGETFDVVISAVNMQGLTDATFDINYDYYHLEFVDIAMPFGSNIDITDGGLVEEGKIEWAIAYAEAATADCDIAVITFKALASYTTSSVNIKPTSWEGTETPFAATGSISTTGLPDPDIYTNETKSVSLTPPESVKVIVDCTNFAGTEYADLRFNYDPEFLEFVNLRNLCTGASTDGGHIEAGVCTYSFMFLESADRDSDLVEIEFRLLQPGTTTVTMDIGSWGGTEEPAPASITITNPASAATFSRPVVGMRTEFIGGETESSLRFIPDESGEYAFSSSSVAYDPVGYIYDSNMNLVASNDDANGENPYDFSVKANLNEGQLYYLVSTLNGSATGTYDVSIKKNVNFNYTIEDDEVTITGCADYIGGGIEIPATIEGLPVVAIADDAFANTNMTSVIIPSSVKTIGNGAFSGCYNLWSVSLTDGLETIGEYAFTQTYLDSINIPATVTSIGYGCFNKTYSLDEITVDENNTVYSSENGVLYNKDKTELLKYPCDKYEESFTIPATVKKIAPYAFENAYYLDTVAISESVEEIAEYAFYSTELSSITIPANVKTIGESAFENCWFMSNLIIENGVTAIGNNAFAECQRLSSVSIPESLTAISDRMFFNCYNLKTVTLPSSITTIGEYAFTGCGFENVVIPDNVKEIGAYAFDQCYWISNVSLGSSLEKIGAYAFSGCYYLTKVIIPVSVTTIEEKAFGYDHGKDKCYFEEFVIEGYSSSEAERYANENAFIFRDPFCEHTETEIRNAVEVTCTSGGYSGDTYCKNCSILISSGVVIEATGHNIEHKTTPATCIATGEEYDECINCGEISDKKEIPLAACTFGDWNVTTQATCTQEGLKVRKCTLCDKEESEVIAKKDHNLEHVTIPSTCIVAGMEYDICTECDETFNSTVLELTDHISEVVPGKAATCTSTGLTDGAKCSVCDAVLTAQAEVPVKDHTYGEWITTAEATCVKEGQKVRTCTVCSAEDTQTTAKTEHSAVKVPEKNPTCTETGLTEGTKCSVCNAVLTAQTEIAAKGHTFGEWKTTKEATYINEGERTKTCSCGEKQTEKIAKLVAEKEAVDKSSNVAVKFTNDTYNGEMKVTADKQFDGTSYQILNNEKGKFKNTLFDITTSVNGKKVQPDGMVLVGIPLPEGYNAEETVVYYVAADGLKKMNSFYKDGMIWFETDHFSAYALVDESSENTTSYAMGDVNGDNKITAADARLVLRVSAKLEKLSQDAMAVADATKDNKITAADARLILRVSAKLDKFN